MLPACAELDALSNFTFLRGASHPEELVAQASALGYRALAIVDECSVSGVVRAHLAAKECGLHLVIGAQFALADAPSIERVILLACSREGYGNLCELISLARGRMPKGSYRLLLADLACGLPHCLAIVVPSATVAASEGGESVAMIGGAFPGACWVGVVLAHGPDDGAVLERASRLAAGLPLVACGAVQMHRRERKTLHDVLTAIREGLPLAELGTRVLPNAERCLRPIARLARLYPPELLMESVEIASRCTFSLDELRYEYPRELVPDDQTASGWLRQLTVEGLHERYPRGTPDHVLKLIEHELALIADLGYEAYFLTVHDIVRFARERGILCQGRGSAANSAVCYALGVTEVDPGRMQVLFERFISKERNEPPDIDVDFEHERREEVMQYIYRKYGRDRAALTAALATYRPRSALRDVGKAFGLSLDQVDRLAKTIAWWDGKQVQDERLVEAGFDPGNPRVGQVVDFAQQLVGFPRHLSQHSGGFVIARDRLTRLVPVENAAMDGRTVIQWDKDDLDALGLLKVDVLALGMLTAVRRTLDALSAFGVEPGDPGVRSCLLHPETGVRPFREGQHVQKARPDPSRPWRLQDIPAEDERTYAMIQRADTIGVFQIESRAQMTMLPRLKPRCFYDLVIEVAIVRPGPIQGGMVHPYLRRRQGLEPVTYPSEAVKGVLERTLGISIFQEQVMQLVVVAAGFSAGEADRVRRAMAAWRRKGGLEPFRDKLLAGMLARGYSADYAEQIFRQIQGFGEYGFPESHAASFALLVYVSCWLKCHHPAAFACGLLNAQPLGFYSPSEIVQDVKRHRVQVLPPDVMVSGWDCVLEGGGQSGSAPALRLGLRMVKGLSEAGAARLVAARGQSPFADLDDLARRAALQRADVNALAAADALRALAGHRREAWWQALALESDTPLTRAPRDAVQASLLPPTEGEDVMLDYSTLGLTLRRHPLALLRPMLAGRRLYTADAVRAARNGQVIRACGIVTCRQRPSTASGVVFVTLEDETGHINVVVWPTIVEKQRRELLGSRLMTVYGHVQREGEVVHLVAGRLVDDTRLLGRLVTTSRDFG
ncbi:MAG: error-prone DNA polymerase [bacterium]|jgi:error-prone DNA polymerase|nr:error-prone DNA polymerase [Betaproteobacteria bacterium]